MSRPRVHVLLHDTLHDIVCSYRLTLNSEVIHCQGWIREMQYDPLFQCCRGDIQRKWAWFQWRHRYGHPTRTPLGHGYCEELSSLRKVWGEVGQEIHLSLGNRL